MKKSILLVLAAGSLLLVCLSPLTFAQSKSAPTTGEGVYRITLASGSSPHQVKTPDDGKRNWFVEVGSTFGGADGKRFMVQNMVEKLVPDVQRGLKDVSEMTIVEKSTGKAHVLVMKVEYSLPAKENGK